MHVPHPAKGASDPRVTAASNTSGKPSESADKEAEEKRSLVGVTRMGVVERRVVRIIFILSILCSLGTGICAVGPFFRLAEL